MPRESKYQTKLIKEIERRLPGSIVLKNDSSYRQGILDLIVLWGWQWGMLEVKAYENAPEQPNQAYYVRLLDEMSFAAIICPENEEVILNELELTFRTREDARRNAFVSQPE